MRRALAALGALVVTLALAGCNRSTQAIERVPYDAGNITVHSIGVIAVPGDKVKGLFNVTVVKEPRAIEVYVKLYYKYRGFWQVEADEIWHRASFPKKGHPGNVLPIPEAFCAPGLWAIELHLIGTTEQGDHRDEYLVWPGKRRKLGTFIGSESPIPTSDWPGARIKCIGHIQP